MLFGTFSKLRKSPGFADGMSLKWASELPVSPWGQLLVHLGACISTWPRQIAHVTRAASAVNRASLCRGPDLIICAVHSHGTHTALPAGKPGVRGLC
jgi:hypothetical protein